MEHPGYHPPLTPRSNGSAEPSSHRDPYPPRDGWHLVLGPPGTGKTHTLLRYLDELLDAGFAPEAIAFVTFTRAARADAKGRAAEKLGISQEQLPWFRTIHSTAFRLLDCTSKEVLITPPPEFARKYGYEFSRQQVREDEDVDMGIQTADDRLLATHAWGRSRMYDLEYTANRSPFRIERDRYLLFAERYDCYRQENGKIDFHDMLEMALTRDIRPSVNVAFIDEAQDLSPLQVKLAEKWFRGCHKVFVAGDDDQAIMEFQGGDPDWLVRLSKECGRVETLTKSRRVPARVHKLALTIITNNENRVDKHYQPRSETGVLAITQSIDEAMGMIDLSEGTFVLARNWCFLEESARELRHRHIPFVVERRPQWSPLSKKTAVAAVSAVLALTKNQSISARQFERILDKIPSTKEVGLLKRGIKKKASENKAPVNLDSIYSHWTHPKLADAIREHGVDVLIKVPADLRHEITNLIEKYGTNPRPRVWLTTAHSAKGRERDTVIVLPDMTRSTYNAFDDGTTEEREAEFRVAYVAVTRAIRRLIVIESEDPQSFPYAMYARQSMSVGRVEINPNQAMEILKKHPRYAEEEEAYVIGVWNHTLSNAMCYPELRLEADRYHTLARSLQIHGLPPKDARWAAYLYVSQEARSKSREKR